MLDTNPIRISQLRKHFGNHEVLHGVELSVATGCIHGLVGLNGAGKTTTLSCLLGLQPYNSGTVHVFGSTPNQLYRFQGKVAVVFDEPCLHPNLTVGDALRFAQISTGLRTAEPNQLQQLEKLLSIERYHDFKIRQLSLGNRRRTAIAQALVGRPQLIIMDEPFNGLDAGGVDDVLALIRDLNREQGITFLLASHQLSYLERTCSHMAILHHGKIAASGTITDLLSSNQHRVTIQTNDDNRARSLIASLTGVTLLDDSATTGIACRLDSLNSAQLNRALVNDNIDVSELVLQRASLENLFHQVTSSKPDPVALEVAHG